MDIKEWEAQQAGAQGISVDEFKAKGAAFKDFDEFFDEKQAPPLVIHYKGADHNLPGDMPAILMLKVYRAESEAKEKGLDTMLQALSERDVLEMAEAIFGKERLADWASGGLQIGQLEAMVTWCAEQYQLRILERNGLDPKTAATKKQRPGKGSRR